MSFSDDIKKFNEKVEKAATNIFRGTALGVMNKIIMRTPVDTGRLRGNWFSSINRPINQIDGNSEGTQSTASRAKLGDTIYLVNNLPYARVIEDGSSGRPPVGMVKATVAEYQAIFKENARKHKV